MAVALLAIYQRVIINCRYLIFIDLIFLFILIFKVGWYYFLELFLLGHLLKHNCKICIFYLIFANDVLIAIKINFLFYWMASFITVIIYFNIIRLIIILILSIFIVIVIIIIVRAISVIRRLIGAFAYSEDFPAI